MAENTDNFKQQAAAEAIKLVENKMIVGLGSGSTAYYAIDLLAKRVAQGLDIRAIATSEQSRQQAEQGGIQMTSFTEHPEIDITIDGADEVEEKSLNLIKGLGGALLQEKMVALMSKKFVIIVDESKLVKKLGIKSPLSVEIVPFAWETTKSRVSSLCSNIKLRVNADGKPVITDGGHYILDCKFNQIDDPSALCKNLKLITGVVETGLFIDIANLVIIAGTKGLSRLTKSSTGLY